MDNGAKSIAAVIIVIIIAVGGYAIFHKSYSPPASSSTNSSSQSNVPSVNNAVVITKTDARLGKYLADPAGKPLYTYNADTSGVSNCTGSCLARWPAYQATGSTTNLPTDISTITRADNHQTQYTYKGMPLYYFVSDSNRQVTGDGVENFSIAKPSAAASSQPAQTPAQNNTSSGNPY